MSNNDGISELNAIAEAAADSSLKETAGIIDVPVQYLYKNLGRDGLRLLCISVAHAALAAYLKSQCETVEAQRDS